MEFNQLEAFYARLAGLSTDINHSPASPRFGSFDIEEVVTGLKTTYNFKHFNLLLEAPTGSFTEESDQHWDETEVAYLVCRLVATNDMPGRRATLTEALRIGKQFLARTIQERIFPTLKLDEAANIRYEKVGPIWGNVYGYRISFTSKNPTSIRVDRDQWSDAGNQALPYFPANQFTPEQIIARYNKLPELRALLNQLPT